MKTTLRLTKAFYNGASAFSKGRLKEMKEQKQGWLGPLAVIGITIGIVSVFRLLLGIYSMIQLVSLSLDKPWVMLFFALSASGLFIFIFSFLYALSILFQAKDLRLLQTLPVTSLQLLASRLLSLYLFLLPWYLTFILPAFVVQVRASGIDLLALLAMVLIAFFSQTVPIMLSGALSMLLVHSTGTFRRKTLIETMMMLLFLVVFIGIQSVISRVAVDPEATEQMILALLNKRLETLSRVLFLPTAFARGLQEPLRLLFALALTLLACALLGIGMRWRYERILSNDSVSITGTKDRVSGRAKRAGDGRMRPVWVSLVFKDLSVIASNSTFLTESTMQAFILPVLLGIMYAGNSVTELEGIIDTVSALPFFELALLGLFLLFVSLGSLSSTSISREGSSFSLTRLLPVSADTHLAAKVVLQYLFFIPMVLSFFVLSTLFFDIGAMRILLIILVGMLCAAPSVLFALYIDCRRPLLNWSNPAQAMKQNLNVLVSMGVNLLYLALLALLAFALYLLQVSVSVILLSLCVGGIGILSLVVPLLRRAAYDCFSPS